jgi:hypothetical protein
VVQPWRHHHHVEWLELPVTAVHVHTMPAGFADAVGAHLSRIARPARNTQQLLASAYAQRLSLLRSDCSEQELRENSRCIDHLESRFRTERTTGTAALDPHDEPGSEFRTRPHAALTVDPALYLG